MRLIEFEIPEPTPLMNVWQRMHWTARGRLTISFSWLVKAAVGRVGEPIGQCEVEVYRYSSGTPDWDGLYGGLKPLLDCLVVRTKRNPHGLGLIEDDCPSVIKTLTARPMPAKRKEGKTRVVIREV